MLYDMAVESTGSEVWLVKDNKIIGEGWVGASSSLICSVEMRDDRAKELVKNSNIVQMWLKGTRPEKAFKWSLFKFAMWSGRYVDTPEDDDWYVKELEGVRVVDKRRLAYGMVPDDFKDCEGYQSHIKEAIKEMDKNG